MESGVAIWNNDADTWLTLFQHMLPHLGIIFGAFHQYDIPWFSLYWRITMLFSDFPFIQQAASDTKLKMVLPSESVMQKPLSLCSHTCLHLHEWYLEPSFVIAWISSPPCLRITKTEQEYGDIPYSQQGSIKWKMLRLFEWMMQIPD